MWGGLSQESELRRLKLLTNRTDRKIEDDVNGPTLNDLLVMSKKQFSLSFLVTCIEC